MFILSLSLDNTKIDESVIVKNVIFSDAIGAYSNEKKLTAYKHNKENIAAEIFI